jgi:hypothetical protein
MLGNENKKGAKHRERGRGCGLSRVEIANCLMLSFAYGRTMIGTGVTTHSHRSPHNLLLLGGKLVLVKSAGNMPVMHNTTRPTSQYTIGGLREFYHQPSYDCSSIMQMLPIPLRLHQKKAKALCARRLIRYIIHSCLIPTHSTRASMY